MAKILKFVWLTTLLGSLAALLWVYASVPLTVKIAEEAEIGKEGFFYLALAFLTISNFSLYALSKNNFVGEYEYLKMWKYTFGMIVNGFFVFSMFFIQIYNGTARFTYDNFGYLIIIFLVLMVMWLLMLPFLIIFRRKTG